MKNLYFFSANIFSFLIILYGPGFAKTDCLDKEKALALLETAEDFLSKAKDSYPTCKEDSNSNEQSECGKLKSLAYIEISQKLIADVREYFSNCSKDVVQHVKARDCAEILANGRKKSGVYTIWPSESNATGNPLQVYCDMETDGGGWTVIQRRGNFSVQQDFYQDWESYKKGFGKITEEFWLGNENIRVLCHKGCEIRFDLEDKNGKKGFAVYNNFNLKGSRYTLHISDYTGDVGDSMNVHNGCDFSTKDKGKTSDAEDRKAGWWFGKSEDYSNLNGIYKPGISHRESVYWYSWNNTSDNLSKVEIKVRRKNSDFDN